MNSVVKGAGLVVLFLALAINFRYGVAPIEENIRFFIAIYDPLDNLFRKSDSQTQLLTCPDNNCTLLDYKYHAPWTITYYERFVGEGQVKMFRRARLYIHTVLQSIAWALPLLQFSAGLRKNYPALHRWLGRLIAISVFVSIGSAVSLASEHGGHANYGGDLAKYGFFFMGFICVSTLLVGLVQMRFYKDVRRHREWMIRWWGTMWGSFLIFRIIELLTGPFIDYTTPIFSIQCSIWLSPLLGLLCAELYLRASSSPRKKTS